MGWKSYEKCRHCGSVVVRENTVTGAETRIADTCCTGICIKYDTRSCKGGLCLTCGVSKAGLCCKKYLEARPAPNIMETDCGDYRSLFGAFIRNVNAVNGYDERYRQKTLLDEAKANALYDNLRRQAAAAYGENLIFMWNEYTPGEFLALFPGIDRRPVRIEIQIAIFLFYNHRYHIDIEYAAARFQIEKQALNRYLQAYFGYSYSCLLSKIRNEHSKILLGIPLLRIGEISALVGYKSHSHFTISFNRYEGISPKEYRKSVMAVYHAQNN